jgi:hypothetical protein
MKFKIKLTQKRTIEIEPTLGAYILAGTAIGTSVIGAGLLAPSASIAWGTGRIALALGVTSLISNKIKLQKGE